MSTTTADPAVDPHDPRPTPGTEFDPVRLLRRGLKAVASLRLTVGLFVLSIGLIFFGTVAQMDYGIWTVVDKYFWSWVVMVPTDLFNKVGQVFFGFPREKPWTGTFPFPGGKLLGGLLLANLLAAHLTRFRLTWKRSGVLITHAGLVLLFVGEFVTREYAVEQQMAITEGQSADFTQDTRNYELAFVTPADAATDHVVVVPERMLRRAGAGGRISDPELPVDIEVVKFMKNSVLQPPGPGVENPATAGAGLRNVAVEAPEEAGVKTKQTGDAPAVYVKLTAKDGKEIGTYLVSAFIRTADQPVEVGGKTYSMTYRPARYYKPYSLYLKKFTFDRYVGTSTPKNYQSDVVLHDPEYGDDREVTIKMNSPLRHRGETFYQADFDKETEKTTYLQVVKNPGWVLPYVSCVVVTVGLLLHFGIYLTQFLSRRAAA